MTPISAGDYNIRVRFREDELERLRESARLNERPLTAEIRYAVRLYLDRTEQT